MVPSLVPGVPDLHRPIPTAGGGDASSVGAERHASDDAGVSLERPQVGMAKPIEVEPFEAAEIGLALPGPFTLQEIQHPADVGVIPLPLGQVQVRNVGGAASHVPLLFRIVSRDERLLLLLLRYVPLGLGLVARDQRLLLLLLSNYPKTLSSPGFYGGYTPFSDNYLASFRCVSASSF